MENNIFFKIELNALECPFIKIGLQPNGKWAGYWCNHLTNNPNTKHLKVRCNKDECPLKKK